MLLVCAVLAEVLYQNYSSALLAAIAAILLGSPLVVSAIKDLWHRHCHMNELVALAVVAAFARDEGLEKLVIVRGDRESVARRVADGMGVSYRAEVLPQQGIRKGVRTFQA